MKKHLLIVLLTLMLLPMQVRAQEDVIIMATVNYPTVRLRDYPLTNDYRTISNVIDELAQGEQVEVYAYFSNSGRMQTWVEVTLLDSGLHGWISSDLLLFDRQDWQAYVPSINSYRELASYLVQNAGSFVSYNSMSDESVRMRSVPCWRTRDDSKCQEVVGMLRPREKAFVLGRAVINGSPSWYVYIRRESDGLEGWVHSYFLEWLVGVPPMLIEAIPVIYEASR